MDWMYNGGVKIQKEDYLLGKKVDSQSLQNTDNGNFIEYSYISLSRPHNNCALLV